MCCRLFMVHYSMTQDEIEWTDNCFNHRDVDLLPCFGKKTFFSWSICEMSVIYMAFTMRYNTQSQTHIFK